CVLAEPAFRTRAAMSAARRHARRRPKASPRWRRILRKSARRRLVRMPVVPPRLRRTPRQSAVGVRHRQEVYQAEDRRPNLRASRWLEHLQRRAPGESCKSQDSANHEGTKFTKRRETRLSEDLRGLRVFVVRGV